MVKLRAGHSPRVSCRTSTTRGQAVIEFLVIVTAALVGLILARGPIAQSIGELFGLSGNRVEAASMTLAQATPEMAPWAGERAQEGSTVVGTGRVPSDIASPPQTPTQPDTQPGKPAPKNKGPQWTDIGGGWGGSDGGSGGGGAVGTPKVPGDRPTTVSGAPQPPEEQVHSLTPAQLALLNAAVQLLVNSDITFTLFDFVQGQSVDFAPGDIVREMIQRHIPVFVADLLNSIEALAAVFAEPREDGTVDLSKPVTMIFDETFLARSTKEMVAAVLAHESWHVHQLFSGIHDDFTNYPRVVDIEYEAFVAGAAVWNHVKGTRSSPALDAGSACVAAGEARCKEILATDFGYPSGPRRPTG